MRTVRALLYRDVLWSIVFVGIAFMSLFFFIDFLGQLEGVGRNGMTTWHALLGALLSQPSRLYELSPIAVLIGTIYAMARLAQSSEYTILRTGGLGPARALWLLLGLGVGLAAFTFVVGEYLAPAAEQAGAVLRNQLQGGYRLGQAGAWLKEHRESSQGALSYSINVESTDASGQMRHVRIFEYDAHGRLRSRVEAASGQAQAGVGGSVWHLADVSRTVWPAQDDADTPLQVEHLATLDWATTLNERLVAAALSPIESMTTLELWRYSRHLLSQEQKIGRAHV